MQRFLCCKQLVVLGLSAGSTRLIIEELYKSSSAVAPVFTAVGAPANALFTAAEVGEVGFAYVTKAGLDTILADKSQVTISLT